MKMTRVFGAALGVSLLSIMLTQPGWANPAELNHFGEKTALQARTAPEQNEMLVLTLKSSTLTPRVSAFLDILGTADGLTTVLGSAQTASWLEAQGVTVVRTQTYAASIAGGAVTETPSAPAAATSGTHTKTGAKGKFPVPKKLKNKKYQTYNGGYRTVKAQQKFRKDLAKAYPHLVQRVTYGSSWKYLKSNAKKGIKLEALRITAGANQDGSWLLHKNQKPRFFLQAQTHAREIMASEIAWRYVSDLVDGYGKDPQITHILDTTEVWVIMSHNPDSMKTVEKALSAKGLKRNKHGDAIPDVYSKAWQRKNANNYGFEYPEMDPSLLPPGMDPTELMFPKTSIQPGVDLNRNWSYLWGQEVEHLPFSLVYPGQYAMSEPEVNSQANLLSALFKKQKVGGVKKAGANTAGVYVALHAYYDAVLYPFSISKKVRNPNLGQIKRLAFRQTYFNKYSAGTVKQILGYGAGGGDADWVYKQFGIPSFIYEAGNDDTGGFFPAYSRAEKMWRLNGPALLYATNVAAAPYKLSRGPSVTKARSWRTGAGNVRVKLTATDKTFGKTREDRNRQPKAKKVVALEYKLTQGSQPSSKQRRLIFKATNTATKTFSISKKVLPLRKAATVLVRAKQSEGYWGPWQAVSVPAR